jgi:hypothetical protein
MKPRFRRHCCPVCRHHVGYGRLYSSRPFHGEWQCLSCQTWLQVDYSSRILVGLFIGIWGVFLLVIVHARDVRWTTLLFALGALILCQLVRVCVAEDSPRRKEQQHPRETPKET